MSDEKCGFCSVSSTTTKFGTLTAWKALTTCGTIEDWAGALPGDISAKVTWPKIVQEYKQWEKKKRHAKLLKVSPVAAGCSLMCKPACPKVYHSLPYIFGVCGNCKNKRFQCRPGTKWWPEIARAFQHQRRAQAEHKRKEQELKDNAKSFGKLQTSRGALACRSAEAERRRLQ